MEAFPNDVVGTTLPPLDPAASTPAAKTDEWRLPETPQAATSLVSSLGAMADEFVEIQVSSLFHIVHVHSILF
jgi:hypothetical protein